MYRKVRIGIIGPGGRGLSLGRLWTRLECAELVAVSDIRAEALERAKPALAEFVPDCLTTTRNRDLLDRDDIDLVLITTHDAFHAEPAMEALNAGKHVFVEKPLTQEPATAAQLVETARKKGVQLFTGHEMQHCDFVTYALDRITQGAIGKPRMAVTVDSCGRMGNYFRRSNTRTRKEIISLTLQKGVHQLDAQALLLGARPARVYAVSGPQRFGGDKPNDLTCSRCPDVETCAYAIEHSRANGFPYGNTGRDLCVFAAEIDVPDHVCATITYDSGLCASFVECFFTPEYKVEHKIIGDEGQLDILYKYGFPSSVRLSRLNSLDFEERVFACHEGHGGGDSRLAKAVCNAVLEGRPARPDGVDGYYAVAVAHAIARSEEAGEPVDIEPV